MDAFVAFVMGLFVGGFVTFFAVALIQMVKE